MKKSIILIGGGGHCRSCIDVIEAEGVFSIAGILDAQVPSGTEILGYPVLGTDDCISKFVEKGFYFLVTVGQIKSYQVRQKIFQALINYEAKIATVIAPTARVSRYAQLGIGTIAMHGVQVNAGAKVGRNVILNTGSLVEHDAVIGEHVHLSTQAVLNGEVVIEEGCFVGSNAVLAQGIKVKAGSIIGAGSVVIRNLDRVGIYAGNPAKLIE